MATRVLDITGQPCDACDRGGVAKVVHFVKASGNDRFFFGCSASTQDNKCSGSKAWQSIQVPEELRKKALRDKGITREPKTRGRAKKRVTLEGSDEGSDSGEVEEIVTETKTEVKTVTSRHTVRKVKRRQIKDADHWTRASDDEYAE
jgi:hypothetical protein